MSRYENWCLTAHEAAACGLPVLLPRQKWSSERFGNEAHYFSGNPTRDAAVLKEFHDRCPSLPAPKIQLFSWTQVAQQLRGLYEQTLKASPR